jgi:urease accessory protein
MPAWRTNTPSNDPASPSPAPRPAAGEGGAQPAGRKGEGSSPSTLYRMLAWLSPGYPIGAFAYSHGLEAAAESGTVQDGRSLQHWISAVVTLGGGRLDADILRDAHRAAAAVDVDALVTANRRGIAFRATAETLLETTAQGVAFLATCRAAWPEPFLDRWAAVLDEGNEAICYPAAVGAATARAGISAICALTGYLQAMSANLISAGLRLGIIGQTDGQRILAALEPVVGAAAAGALTRDPSSFGGATFAVELASMAHEIQYTRLFRS